MPERILVLCTGNSARSVMTEAWLNHYGGARVEVASAGSDPKGINPLTVFVMEEVGLDVSDTMSEHLDRYRGQPWDYVITVCDNAAESCPVFPGSTTRLHWPFDDPPAAAPDERLDRFRQVRDEIGVQVEAWLADQRGNPH